MKDPKGSYNDDALNDLLKQFMLDEAAAGGKSAEDWLDAEAEAVFASEPLHVPGKARETALIADLNKRLVGNKRGGGLLWKGSALLLVLGVVVTAVLLWPEVEEPLATNNQDPWNEEAEYGSQIPYYTGQDRQAADTATDATQADQATNNAMADNAPIQRLVVRQDNPVTEKPDTLVPIADNKPTAKPRQSTKTLVKELKRRYEAFMEQFPAERVYAQTDRSDYTPGQSIWFTAYLLSESDLKPSALSGIIKTELVNSSGEAVALKEWVTADGRANGDLLIPQDVASGTYLFRAYTAYQQYLPGSKLFETPIVIQQPGQVLRMEDVTGALPTGAKIEFYPEGGDLVVGLQSRVAFQITPAYPFNSGKVVDETGGVVATFTANAEGKGLFTFTPEADKTYYATVANVPVRVELPKAYPDGYVLEVLGQEGNWLKANIRSTKEESVAVVAQMRGEWYYGVEHDLEAGDNIVRIPTANMPAGVLHISLFDADGVGHAERLVFVNKQKQLNVSIKTDKLNYLPREKVTATITVTDDKGRPVKTALSLSAADDLLTHTENTNILSALLLEPDLSGVAERAGYLFNPSNKNAEKQLDLLLMTHGWRRFTWKEVYYAQREPLAVSAENAVLRGKVIDPATGKPLKGVKISNKTLGVKAETAGDGSFYIPNLDLTQFRELDFSYKIGLMTMVINRYQSDLIVAFYADARKVYQPIDHSGQHPLITSNQKNTKGAVVAGQVINAYGDGISGAVVIVTAADGTIHKAVADNKGYYWVVVGKEGNYKVDVSAKGYQNFGSPTVKTDAHQFSMLDVLLPYQVDMNGLHAHFTSHEADSFANRYSFLSGRFEPVFNNPAEEPNRILYAPDNRMPLRDGALGYYVEGMKMRYNEPMMLPYTAIGHMEMFDNGQPAKYNDPNAMVVDITSGTGGVLSGTPKAPDTKPTGFSIRYAQPREYPKVQYTPRDKTADRNDLRSTLYWNGSIITDANGQATVEFFASDDLSAFRIMVEGVGNGMAGRAEQVVGMAWPFDLRVQMPENLRKGEKITALLWVENFAGKQITGNFDFTLPDGLKPIWPMAPNEHGLFPQRSDTITVQMEVIDPNKPGELIVGFTASGYRDVFVYKLPPVGKKEE